MTEDSPKVVNLDTSHELSEFPSEFASEAEFPSEAQPSPDVPEPVVSASASAAKESTPAAFGRVEPTPFGAAATKGGRRDCSGRARRPIGRRTSCRTSATGGARQARDVTEFPVRPHTPAAVALPTLPAGTATLVDLIERRGGLDWREAVAVIHQICLYLKAHSPQAPILLDPRTIQITERGEVHLLSGQTSSDPLVVQVGRLLRTMLMGKEAPPELRLLLSQATFELPIFESIEDVDRALAQLNRLDEPGPAGLALLRAVAAPPPPPTAEEQFDNRPAADSVHLADAAHAGATGPRQDLWAWRALRRVLVTRRRHLRSHCLHRSAAADATGGALPQLTPGQNARGRSRGDRDGAGFGARGA